MDYLLSRRSTNNGAPSLGDLVSVSKHRIALCDSVLERGIVDGWYGNAFLKDDELCLVFSNFYVDDMYKVAFPKLGRAFFSVTLHNVDAIKPYIGRYEVSEYYTDKKNRKIFKLRRIENIIKQKGVRERH